MPIQFRRLYAGHSPLTSDPVKILGTWGQSGWAPTRLGRDEKFVFTLNPFYKRGQRSLYVNIYPADIGKPSRKSQVLYRDEHVSTKIRLSKHVQTGMTQVSVSDVGELTGAECALLVECIKAAEIHGHGKVYTIGDAKFDDVLMYAQPPQFRNYLNSLPSNIYKSLAQRWLGCTSSETPSTKDGCVGAICLGTSPVGVIAHPGYDSAFVDALPDSIYPTDTITPPGTSVNATATTPEPSPAAQPEPEPQQQAQADLPPMPSSTDSITSQIDALTKRAEAAASLAERVDELITEVQTLKNRPQVVINTTPTFTANGKVDIAGKELPHFNLSPVGEWAVPQIKPEYDLNGWRAAFECGDLREEFSLGDVMEGILTTTPTRLIGPPATGKTSGIVQACAHMGIPCRVIQCGKGLTEYTLLGEQTIENGSVVWKDGILPALCRSVSSDGPSVIVFDEVDHLPAAVQSLLHGVLEGRTLDLPNGEKISIPESIIAVATANTYGTGDVSGRHAAASVSDDAFISRWTRTFTVDYLEESREKDLLASFGVPDTRIVDLMKFIGATRKSAKDIDSGTISDGVRTPVTLRTLIPMAQECGGDDSKFRRAFLTTVMGQFSPDEMHHARELVRSTLDM